ncbi:MAG: TonB-dependent receptor [Wenzhouxiangellaceae bacterium]|nr:TonB-dependent receptor [Wenzhouxiangellaceae bacterium]
MHAGAATQVFAQDPPSQDQQGPENEARVPPPRQEEIREDDTTEPDVMTVVGYRGSIQRALDRKRADIGITDAVTAEEMGKFPDQNLAESLQRIPGVSIDRNNNEGSRITVRGLGPEFNLVVLNGRTMPTAGSRSFDFFDLATAGISAVEVYKTPRPDLPTGGIGATVNILTPRPLDRPGFHGVVAGKAVHETSSTESNVGNINEWTPEFEGLISNTFFDDKVGILISGAYQRRDNREENASVDNWQPNGQLVGGTVDNNNQREDGVWWHPQNVGFGWSDIKRVRKNAHAALQYAPTDRFTATFDFTYSRVDFEKDSNSVGIWFECPNIAATINERGTVTRVSQSCGDFSTNIARDDTIKENDQFGLNLDWQATDNLRFTLDAHTSTSEFGGDDIAGEPASSMNLIIGNTSCDWCGFDPNAGPFTATIDEQIAMFSSNGIPLFDVSFRSTGPDGGPQDGLLRQDIGSLFGQAFNVKNENDIDQLQLGGVWENADRGALRSIAFGYDRTEQEFDQRNAFSGLLPAGFWLTSAQFWPDDAFQEGDFSGLLSGFNNGGQFPFSQFFTAPFGFVVDQFETIGSDNFPCCFWPDTNFWTEEFQDPSGTRGRFWPGSLGNNGISRVEENIDSIYLNATLEDEFNGMPINATFGVRYEETDIKSTGQEIPAEAIVWVGGDEFAFDFADEPTLRTASNKNRFWLPSMALNMEILPDVLSRFAYSRSIARPPIGALGPNRDFSATATIGNRNVNTGNPDLEPFDSDNFDLALEWYYRPGSFAAAGFFYKRVDNFLVSTTEERTFEGIGAPERSAIAEQARQQLIDEGISPTNQAVFRRINELLGREATTPIRGTPDDPLAVFRVTTIDNLEVGELWGWEFQIQHLFGQSGFGFQANATLVDGDIKADRNVLNQEFALPGLSDTANIILFYETDKVQARVAWNYREEFLSGFDQFNAPVFTQAFAPIDVNLTYFITDAWSVFVEGLNVNEETQRVFTRFREQVLRANEFGARYNFGMRYRF